MIKVMAGYHPWTQERSPALDAFVPILADGLKWMGYFPERRVFFSLGVFDDELSEDEKFATYDHQVVTRIGWLPIALGTETEVLHLAVMGRDGRSRRGQPASPLEAGGEPVTLLRRHRQVRGRPRATTPARDLLSKRLVAVRRGVQLGEGRRRDRRGADLSRRRRGRDLDHHRGNRGYNAPGGYFGRCRPNGPCSRAGPEPGRPS